MYEGGPGFGERPGQLEAAVAAHSSGPHGTVQGSLGEQGREQRVPPPCSGAEGQGEEGGRAEGPRHVHSVAEGDGDGGGQNLDPINPTLLTLSQSAMGLIGGARGREGVDWLRAVVGPEVLPYGGGEMDAGCESADYAVPGSGVSTGADADCIRHAGGRQDVDGVDKDRGDVQQDSSVLLQLRLRPERWRAFLG